MIRISFLSLPPVSVHGNEHSSSSSSVTPPTLITADLIEKYSKHRAGGSEPWISLENESQPMNREGGNDEEGEQEQQQQLLRKQQRVGLQKRAIAAPEQPGATSSPLCVTFENVDKERKTLYSPGHPNNYPNNTNCLVVLEGNVLLTLLLVHGYVSGVVLLSYHPLRSVPLTSSPNPL